MNFFSEWVGNYKRAASSLLDLTDDLKSYIDDIDVKGEDKVRFTNVPGSRGNEDWNIDNVSERISNFISTPQSANKDFDYLYNWFQSVRPKFIAMLANKYGCSEQTVISKLDSWTYGNGIGAIIYLYYNDNNEILIRMKRLTETKYNITGHSVDVCSFAKDIKRENLKKRNKETVWG